MEKFLPVLLGTDLNAYGMARAFREQYGVKSLAVGEFALLPTRNSKIISVRIFKNFTQTDVFLEELERVAKEYKPQFKNLLLIPCGDAYCRLVIQNKKRLTQNFIVPCIDEGLRQKLDSKEAFYQTCKDFDLDIPKTKIISKEDGLDFKLPFDFPVALKPSNDVQYLKCQFEGKKKAYIILNRQEFESTVKKIYASSYQSNLIAQEFVPGDDSNMRVLNCYVGKDNKVKLMCLGQPLLEDKAPGTVGNYLAIVSSFNEELCFRVKVFLEKIKYTGFANFDLKYDARDGKFKLFEINLRQGRSSFFVSGSGFSLAKYLVEDYILKKELTFCLVSCEHLWLGVPKRLLLPKINKEQQKLVNRLIKEKKVCRTLFYSADRGILKLFNDFRFFAGYYKTFRKYF